MTDEAAGKLTAAIIRLADALATTKEGNEKERSPYNPLKEKAREETLSQTPNACVRVRAGESGCGVRAAFARPSVEEVAAHIREKGYTFDADEFWHFYDSKGWLIGNHVMKSWQSACVTWQKRCNRDARRAEEARERLAVFNERLVPVFDLVVKNGSDREESVCELAARDRNGKKEAEARYSRNLEKILKFFLGQ